MGKPSIRSMSRKRPAISLKQKSGTSSMHAMLVIISVLLLFPEATQAMFGNDIFVGKGAPPRPYVHQKYASKPKSPKDSKDSKSKNSKSYRHPPAPWQTPPKVAPKHPDIFAPSNPPPPTQRPQSPPTYPPKPPVPLWPPHFVYPTKSGKKKSSKSSKSSGGYYDFGKGKGKGKGKGFQFPTISPTFRPSTAPLSEAPTTQNPTISAFPTVSPTTALPSVSPTTASPTVSSAPTITPRPTTVAPTDQPSTIAPTERPTTPRPSTESPTARPSTESPTVQPSTDQPTTSQPTESPTITVAPTESTDAPTTSSTTSSPTEGPTSSMSPSFGPTTSDAPTIFTPERVVPATPFITTYLLVGDEPAPSDFSIAAAITLNYLDNYLSDFYASDPDTDFDGSASFPTSFSTAPERIEYDFTAIFAEDSAVFPRTADIDQLLLTALSPPAANVLVAQLNQLPDSNPFSQTFALDYMVQSYRLPQPSASPSSIGEYPGENYNVGVPTLNPGMTRRPTSPFDGSVGNLPTDASSQPNSSPLLVKNTKPSSDSGSKAGLIVVIVVAIAGGLLALLVLEVRRMKRAQRRSDESDMAQRLDDEASNFLSDGEEISTDPKATTMSPPTYNDMKDLSSHDSWSTGESDETEEESKEVCSQSASHSASTSESSI